MQITARLTADPIHHLGEMNMNEIKSRSPYWLSPGIDVPTQDELLPYYRPLRGFHVDRFWGEAAFVPTEDFMRETPLWRIDVLDDIAEDIRCTRTHALVACFRECQARGHDVPIARQIEAFREVCKMAGIALPDELEALLVLDQQFGRSATWASRDRATR